MAKSFGVSATIERPFKNARWTQLTQLPVGFMVVQRYRNHPSGQIVGHPHNISQQLNFVLETPVAVCGHPKKTLVDFVDGSRDRGVEIKNRGQNIIVPTHLVPPL